ncbi:MAG: hypothetical protein ATN35_04560 [Epulopiscium sp. Nele67-Bin004]|nr:MAG: hypothetical protein ATN35_04560 [Epulopiscium sp. Nele67-Bin004]
MNLELIISDVDGTLIDTSETFSNDFYELAQLIETNNYPLTIATGRTYDQVKPFIENLQITLPVIINNGAGCIKQNKLLWNNTIKFEYLQKALLKADELDMAIILSSGYTDKVYRHNAYIQNQIEKFDRYKEIFTPLTEEEWNTGEIQKVLITDPMRPGKIDLVLDQLQNYKEFLHVVRYSDRSADIMLKQSTKAEGIKRLSTMLSIDTKNMMAIGDSHNDVEMIQEVGMGVAVANAETRLKEIANYICQNSHSKGVLEATKKFYK